MGRKQQPRAFYVDHGFNEVATDKLRGRGIDILFEPSLGGPNPEFDLNNFPVLLIHPGEEGKQVIPEIAEKYPHLSIALVTVGVSKMDRNAPKDGGSSDMPMFYDDQIDEMERFIRDNQ